MIGRISLIAAALAAITIVPSPVGARALVPLEQRQEDFHWVNTWTSMPQLVESNNMPPSPFVGLFLNKHGLQDEPVLNHH